MKPQSKDMLKSIEHAGLIFFAETIIFQYTHDPALTSTKVWEKFAYAIHWLEVGEKNGSPTGHMDYVLFDLASQELWDCREREQKETITEWASKHVTPS